MENAVPSLPLQFQKHNTNTTLQIFGGATGTYPGWGLGILPRGPLSQKDLGHNTQGYMTLPHRNVFWGISDGWPTEQELKRLGGNALLTGKALFKSIIHPCKNRAFGSAPIRLPRRPSRPLPDTSGPNRLYCSCLYSSESYLHS